MTLLGDSSQPEPAPKRRSNVWLASSAVALLLAVVALVVVLLQRDPPRRIAAADRTATLPAAPDGGGGSSAPKPYVNLLDPKNPHLLPGAPPATPDPDPSAPPDPSDPFGAALKGLSALFDDPDLKQALAGLDKTLKHGSKALGKIFGGGASARGRAPVPAPSAPGATQKADPLAQLLNQALSLLGSAASAGGPPSGGGGLFGGLFGGGSGGASGRIAAKLRDDGGAYVVTCTFPRGAPETASFQVRGETLVIKARFGGVDEEQEVELPSAVHPMGARSELKRGELVVTLPKVP